MKGDDPNILHKADLDGTEARLREQIALAKAEIQKDRTDFYLRLGSISFALITVAFTAYQFFNIESFKREVNQSLLRADSATVNSSRNLNEQFRNFETRMENRQSTFESSVSGKIGGSITELARAQDQKPEIEFRFVGRPLANQIIDLEKGKLSAPIEITNIGKATAKGIDFAVYTNSSWLTFSFEDQILDNYGASRLKNFLYKYGWTMGEVTIQMGRSKRLAIGISDEAPTESRLDTILVQMSGDNLRITNALIMVRRGS